MKDEVSIQILTKVGTGSADLCVSIGCCRSHVELVSVELLHHDQQAAGGAILFPQSDSILPLQQERALGGGALGGCWCFWLFGVLILGRFAVPSSVPTPTSLFAVTFDDVTTF